MARRRVDAQLLSLTPRVLLREPLLDPSQEAVPILAQLDLPTGQGCTVFFVGHLDQAFGRGPHRRVYALSAHLDLRGRHRTSPLRLGQLALQTGDLVFRQEAQGPRYR